MTDPFFARCLKKNPELLVLVLQWQTVSLIKSENNLYLPFNKTKRVNFVEVSVLIHNEINFDMPDAQRLFGSM